jgi:hypothetical protein
VGKRFNEDEYGVDVGEDEGDGQSYFSSLFEDTDTCPECGSGPLLLRSNGYVCPNNYCRKLVFKHEDV